MEKVWRTARIVIVTVILLCLSSCSKFEKTIDIKDARYLEVYDGTSQYSSDGIKLRYLDKDRNEIGVVKVGVQGILYNHYYDEKGKKFFFMGDAGVFEIDLTDLSHRYRTDKEFGRIHEIARVGDKLYYYVNNGLKKEGYDAKIITDEGAVVFSPGTPVNHMIGYGDHKLLLSTWENRSDLPSNQVQIGDAETGELLKDDRFMPERFGYSSLPSFTELSDRIFVFYRFDGKLADYETGELLPVILPDGSELQRDYIEPISMGGKNYMVLRPYGEGDDTIEVYRANDEDGVIHLTEKVCDGNDFDIIHYGPRYFSFYRGEEVVVVDADTGETVYSVSWREAAEKMGMRLRTIILRTP